MTSYDIKQAMESSIQNFWPVPHTTAYEEPARLAAAGYLAAQQEEGGRRRRVYSLTDRAARRWPPGPPSRLRRRRSCATKLMLKALRRAPTRRRCWSRGSPGTGRNWRSCAATSSWSAGEGFEGSERTLVAGIAYEEKMLEMLERGSPRPASEGGREVVC